MVSSSAANCTLAEPGICLQVAELNQKQGRKVMMCFAHRTLFTQPWLDCLSLCPGGAW